MRTLGSSLGSLRRPLLSLLFVGVGVAWSSIALAQDPPKDPPAAQTDPAKVAEARAQFDAGVALLDDPDGARYEQAYHAFKRAYELSQSPKVLGNIGFCAMKLERDGEAIDSYNQYLRDVPDIDLKEKVQIQKDLLTLTSTIGRMEITIKHDPPNAKFVLVDHRNQARGEPIENGYPIEGGKKTVIRLRPGRHTMKITANGTEDSFPYDVSIEPNGITSHEFTFPVPTADDGGRSRKGGSHAAPIVLGAFGLAGLATGGVFGILASNKESDIADSCPNDTCPASYNLANQRTKAKTLGTIADIGFIGGGTLLGAAIIWYLLIPSGSSEAPKTRGAAWAAPSSSSNTARSWLSSTGAMCTSLGCNVSLKRDF
jgi:hypothetical protein